MDKTEARLKRIEGQIAGIRKMYKEGRECLDIAQQIAAVRSALASVGKEVLSDEAIRCASSAKESEKFEKMIRQLFTMN